MKFIKKIITFFKVFFQKRKLRKQNKQYKIQPMGASFINPNATIINVGSETSVLDVDLIDDSISEKGKKKVRQYTKSRMDIILFVSLLDIQLCFLLAFLDKAQIAETLAIALVTEVVALFAGYFPKSFFETYFQKKNELEMEKIKHTYEVNKPTLESDDEQAVG